MDSESSGHKVAIVVAILLSCPSIGRGQSSAATDAKVQSPELKSPEHGSLAGALANSILGPSELTRGAIRLTLPIAVPSERGPLLAEVFPSYSPEAGISEWGIGWSAALSISRTRLAGDVDYATDDLASPWGRLVRGTDGAWYPVGLSKPVRVEWDGVGPDITAFMPDGTRMMFGGAARQSNARGTFAWYLTEVRSIADRVTSLDWVGNGTGRMFLDKVRFGGVGKNFQYVVEFTYEPIQVPFEDFRSGVRVLLDKRIIALSVKALEASTGVYIDRWHYYLAYQSDSLGPGFFLTALQQEFPGKERPPAVRYEYAQAEVRLSKAGLVRNTRLDSLLSTLGADALQPNRSAAFDVEDDGLTDIEHSTDYQLAHQTGNGFVIEPLAESPGNASIYCRRPSSKYNPPRRLVRLRSGLGDETPYVAEFRVDPTNASTEMTTCSRVGVKLWSQQLSGDWAPSATVKLVDINRDHLPDLIRISTGKVEILPNTSGASGVAFGAMISGALQPTISPDSAWVQDMNGDGIPDIVARHSTGIVVWHGKGGFRFDTDARNYLVYSDLGLVSPLSEYSFTFVDANKDGLTDLLLTKTVGNSTYLFINNGTSFRYTSVPGLRSVNGYTSPPLVADLSGSGNIELSYTRGTLGYSVTLDGPETGLMVSANDGKGTRWSISYKRAAPYAGIRSRQSVVGSVLVQSAGFEPDLWVFGYERPVEHGVGKFLIGFGRVTRSSSRGMVEGEFDNTERWSGVPLGTVTSDAFAPQVQKFESNTYEQTEFQGIAWPRLVEKSTGWSAPGQIPISSNTRIVDYADQICPRLIVEDSSSGSLTTEKNYSRLPEFEGHLACLLRDVREQGRHSDKRFDFDHHTIIERNHRGQVVDVISESGGSEWGLQHVQYEDSTGFVSEITVPGKGTTRFEYDSAYLLRSVVGPDGVATTVLQRNPITDSLRALQVDRGGMKYSLGFQWDRQERLVASWNDLDGTTEHLPTAEFAYRYANGDVLASLVRTEWIDRNANSARRFVDLVTASDAPVATLRANPNGWSIGEILVRRQGGAEQEVSLRHALSGSIDPGTLDLASLLGDEATEKRWQLDSQFGHAAETRHAYHDGVVRHIATDLSLTGGWGIRSSIENDKYSSQTLVDDEQRVWSYQDEEGARYLYRYDSLGRLREVELPDGARHTIEYDGHGRVSRISRERLSSVGIEYDIYGRDEVRHYYDREGALARSLVKSFDGVGRTIEERHVDEVKQCYQIYRYYFDGDYPGAQGSRDALGLLTAVEGEGFQKRFEYRADGQMLRRSVEIPGWRSVETRWSYYASNVVHERDVSVLDSGGGVWSSSSLVDTYDNYGRLSAMEYSGTHLELVYDDDDLLSVVGMSSGDLLEFTYEPLTRELVSTMHYSPGWAVRVSHERNDRGLVSREQYETPGNWQYRDYGYSDRGFLMAVSGQMDEYQYDYDQKTFSPTRIRKNGSDIFLTYDEKAGTIDGGATRYQRDVLGRTIARGDLTMEYGPNGQVSAACRGPDCWSYFYDEKGQRLLKLANGYVVAAYLEEGYLDDAGVVQPVTVAGATVGLIDNGSYESLAADLRGTVVADAAGDYPLASPYGQRDVHPMRAAVIDYIAKGFDADLGLVRIGVRDYDPEISQFLTPDPKQLEDADAVVFDVKQTEGYLRSGAYLNVYAYALNSPISYVDRDGKAPGDVFRDVRSAGVDAVRSINSRSISENREYGGMICGKRGVYFATKPNQGGATSCNVGSCPKGSSEAGDYHTHAGKGPRAEWDEHFSPEDRIACRGACFLGTPRSAPGTVKELDPRTTQEKEIDPSYRPSAPIGKADSRGAITFNEGERSWWEKALDWLFL